MAVSKYDLALGEHTHLVLCEEGVADAGYQHHGDQHGNEGLGRHGEEDLVGFNPGDKL